MNYNKILYPCIVYCLVILTISCQSEYTKLVKQEMAKDQEVDELLFDLRFGQPKQQFYDRCTELNKKGLVTQGPNNRYAQFILEKEPGAKNTSDIAMLFYATTGPMNQISGMDLKFYYTAWAPWNEQLYAEYLMPVVLDSLMSWFPGNGFIEVKTKNQPLNMVKVDGNRQIRVFIEENKKDVAVLIEDLKLKYDGSKL